MMAACIFGLQSKVWVSALKEKFQMDLSNQSSIKEKSSFATFEAEVIGYWPMLMMETQSMSTTQVSQLITIQCHKSLMVRTKFTEFTVVHIITF